MFEIIKNDVVLVNQVSEMDAERNVPMRDVVTRLVDNKIILGKKRSQLNLVLLQPKQRVRPGELDATVGKTEGCRTFYSQIWGGDFI